MKRSNLQAKIATASFVVAVAFTIAGFITMRKITHIIIHCSAVRPNQTSSAKEIDRWHKAQGWRQIGYHYVIRRDGTVEHGRPVEQIGAHCSGYNLGSIGICYEGGLDANGKPADTRTEAQKRALHTLITDLKIKFPNAKVVGHHDLNPKKACPCFDVKAPSVSPQGEGL